MAQRVCLIPWHPQHVAFVRAWLGDDAAAQKQATETGRRTARVRHLLDRVSEAYGQRLRREEMTKAGLLDLYYQATTLRPYLACVASAQAAVALVDALSRCADEASASQVLDQQLLLLDRAMVSPNRPELPPDRFDEMWSDLPGEVDRLRLFRRLIAEGKPYETQREKRIETADGQITVLVGQFEKHTVPVEDLPGQFGFSVGWLFGRLCALTMPTWWQGRNIWLGRMCEWGKKPEQPAAVRDLAEKVWALCRPVSELLTDLAPKGFEAGLPPEIPTYTVSCHVPPENVARLQALVTADRAAWANFVAAGTGHEVKAITAIVPMYEEACLWAQRHGCGLMEGDDLVPRVF